MWSAPKSLGCAGLLLMLCASLAGCVEQATANDTTVFRFERWLPLTVLAASLAGLPLAWLIRTKIARLGYGLLILIPIMLVVVVPGLWGDRVSVDHDGFSLKTGFWFSPTRCDVRFDEVQTIRHVSYIERGRRGDVRKYKLIVQSRRGHTQSVPSGDLMRYAVPTILETAQDRGIDVRDET
jgi:hypothetical protein